jgi:sortase A
VNARRRSRGDFVVRAIGLVGRIFVGAGILMLFFTAYLLWGTGLYTKEQQKHAESTLAKNPIVSDKALAEGKIPAARPEKPAKLGEPLFSIKIPKIGLDTVIVHGVGVEELKKGPGLFPDCVSGETSECVKDVSYPGESGNVAVSGHRTTYGAPFFRLNELTKGDTIDFISGRARYRYKVRQAPKIVDPVSGFSEVEQSRKPELTLTTCHPRFSAAQRLVIKANFEGSSLVAARPAGSGPVRPSPPPVIPSDVIVLACIAIACALASLALSKRYRWAAASIAVMIVAGSGMWVTLFPWLVTLMPANY